MAQLSRPYQIGLAAVALLAAAWLLLFQGHNSSPSGSSSQAPSAPAQTASAPSAPAKASAQGTAGQAAGHGSASSLGALGHSIEKARGAVATSQKNAAELERKSAQASSPSSPSASTSAPSASTHSPSPSSSSSTSSANAAGAAGAAAQSKTVAPSTKAVTPAHVAPKTSPSTKGQVRANVALRQHVVEAQLATGKIVLIFFWNPKGSDDRAVDRSLAQLPHGLNIAVDRARANAVTTFGTITRGVQVYGTPTLLVVNKKGEVTTLTGLQDPYTIAQAIREARH
jgi:hypothetical protein